MDRTLRVLMIGAHPDDCEMYTGGIAFKYRQLGHIVKFVSATTGDTGHYEEGGGALALRRAEEARQAAATAGIESQLFDIPSNQLVPDLAARAKFIALIREFRPDLVFTHRPNDYHPDHRYTSQLVQDSAYAVIVPNVLPLTPPLRRRPVILYMYDEFTRPNELRADVIVDLEDAMEAKRNMLHCHASQFYEWLPWTDGESEQVPSGEEERLRWLTAMISGHDGRVAARYRDRLIERYGPVRGKEIRWAEAFEICEYGTIPAEPDLALYFPF